MYVSTVTDTSPAGRYARSKEDSYALYVSAALQAGFVGTLAMSLLMSMARAMDMTRMPSFKALNGAMVSRDVRTAEPMGAFVHGIVMGTVVFGVIYGLLFQVFTLTWLAGLIIGIVHGLIVGVVAMPMMPMMHPAMRPDGVPCLPE